MRPGFIYLDNAATSWPRSPVLAQALADAARTPLGNPGRAAHTPALHAHRILSELRDDMAFLLGVTDPSRLILTPGCTHALNLAILGVLIPRLTRRSNASALLPLRVITTALDHNAVRRPLAAAAALARDIHPNHDRPLEIVVVAPDHAGFVHADSIRPHINDATVLVTIPHASNVIGTVQPIAEIAALLRAHPARPLLLVDAAQTAGLLPIHADQWHADLVACSAHKALLGPTGIGALALSTRVHQPPDSWIHPLLTGGSGADSLDENAPSNLPDRLEPGTPNVIAAAALLAVLRDRSLPDPSARLDHERSLVRRLMDRIRNDAVLRARLIPLGPADRADTIGILALDTHPLDPHAIAASLDASYHIAVRAGLHCAPLASGRPTLRISPGPFTTPQEIDALVHALHAILSPVAARPEPARPPVTP